MQRLDTVHGAFLTNALSPRSVVSKTAWVALLLAISTAARWLLDRYLTGEIPFFLYLPAILVIAAYCGQAAGFSALAGALLLTVYLWIPPTPDGWLINPAALLSLLVWSGISSLLIVVIGLLQKYAFAQRELLARLSEKSRRLEENAARLQASESQLAAHADDLERLVAERTAKLQETVAELESFSYTVSHDLRSPLRTMQGFAHLLIEDYGDRLDAQGCDYLARIDRAAQRLDMMIHDVLSYSSLGRAPIVPEPVDLDVVLDEVLDQYPLIRDTQPPLQVDRPLLPVFAAKGSLMQALSNLLQNAVKFVAPGTAPSVHVWTDRRGDRVRLHVTDRGIGISAAELAQIFKPFHRGRNSSAYAGTGMGLAIARRAIERQGGLLGVTSELGQGSDFWIELPAVDHSQSSHVS